MKILFMVFQSVRGLSEVSLIQSIPYTIYAVHRSSFYSKDLPVFCTAIRSIYRHDRVFCQTPSNVCQRRLADLISHCHPWIWVFSRDFVRPDRRVLYSWCIF